MANETARALRKRMTIAETLLWSELRKFKDQGYHFRRQAPIESYIVDFVCFAQRLIVEVDGIQHEQSERALRDSNRDAHLRSLCFEVVRIGNGDVMENMDGVLTEVLAVLGAVVRHD